MGYGHGESKSNTEMNEHHLRWAAHDDSHGTEDRVALAVAERVVHRRGEQREAEAGTRAEERHRSQRCSTIHIRRQ